MCHSTASRWACLPPMRPTRQRPVRRVRCASVMRGPRRWLPSCRLLADLIECVPPIAGVWPDLAGPAAQLDRLCPRSADQHVRPLDLVEGAVTRPLVRDLLFLAADAHGEGFAFGAGDGLHAGHLEQIGYVLGVVDLIEESLLVRIHVHARDEEVFRVDRHAILLSAGTAGEPSGRVPRLTADTSAHQPHGNVSVALFTSAPAADGRP